MTMVRNRTEDCSAWLIAGTGLLLSCLGWTLLSYQFEFGQGHADRPIIGFLGLFLLAWVSFLAGIVLLARRDPGPKTLILIVVVGLLARVVLIPSNLIQENDVYRYVLDGQVLLHGANPYQYAPLVVSDLATESLQRELRKPQAVSVFSRIGYPEIPTVYPPAAQLTFAFGAWLGAWNWMGQRWTLLLVDLGVFLLLVGLLKRLTIPVGWVLLYLWNPLVLKEVVNSVHVDVLVALFVLAAIAGLARQDREGGIGWALLSGLALGMAILSKLYPIVLIPACFFFLRRRTGRGSSAWVFVVSALLISFLGFLPFLWVGFDRLSEGLFVYANRWTMNAGAFSVLSLLSSHPRTIAAAMIGLFAVLRPSVRGKGTIGSLVEDFQWVLLIWFLLIPAPFPWYALPLMALLPLRPRLSAVSGASLMLSGVSAAYYLSFFYRYHDYPSPWWEVTRGIEHGVLWIFLAVFLVYELVFRNRHAPLTIEGGCLSSPGTDYV